MITYVLILYISVHSYTLSTGGPTIIDGFTTLEKCEFAHNIMKTKLNQHVSGALQEYDWGQCIKVEK